MSETTEPVGQEPEVARPRRAYDPTTTVSLKWVKAKERGGWAKTVDGAELFVSDDELAAFQKAARVDGKDTLRGVSGEERLNRLHFERAKSAAGESVVETSTLAMTQPDTAVEGLAEGSV